LLVSDFLEMSHYSVNRCGKNCPGGDDNEEAAVCKPSRRIWRNLKQARSLVDFDPAFSFLID
jgi:hypothetical protein